MPTTPPNIIPVSYADDISLLITGTDIQQMTNKLNDYLSTLSHFLKSRNLTLSPSKSTVTLFTPDAKQSNFHPQVTINNNVLPLNKNQPILGMA